MIFALISPLRVRAAPLPQVLKSVAALFAAPPAPLPQGWHMATGVRSSFRAVTPARGAATADAATGFFAQLEVALSRVRRAGFALRMLPDAAQDGVEAALVILASGDMAVVQWIDTGNAQDPLSTLAALDHHRAASETRLGAAAPLIPQILTKLPQGDLFEPAATITHAVLFCETPADHAAARACFESEGLPFDPAPDAQFQPGWSYSAVINADPATKLSYLAMMTRVQCTWFTTRTHRDYCLRTLRTHDEAAAVDTLIATERQIVARRTLLRLWQHDFQEYRANLSPDLTRAADAVEALWQVGADQTYVHETLSQARENIQNAYASRLLIQERRQSVMISALTAISILGIASTAGEFWRWLTLAQIADNADIATPLGRAVITGGLAAVVCLAAGFWLTFLVIRRRRE
jgi:hypothetical protein